MNKSIFVVLCLAIGGLLHGGGNRLVLTKKQEIYEKSILINSITAMALDQAKNIYLLDGKKCRVHKFTPQGKYLLSFGRPGQGPGDLHMPIDLAVTDKNEIAVSTRLDGIRFFAANGKHIDRPFLPGKPQKVRWIGGNLYCCEGRANTMGSKQMVVDGSMKILLDDVNRMELAVVSMANGGVFAWLDPTYSSLLFATCAYGQAALANSSSYRITLVNSQGKLVKVIERKLPKVPITAEEKSWLKKQMEKKAPPAALKGLLDLLPASKNFISGLRLSPTQLWVRRLAGNVWDEDIPEMIDVLTLDGQFLTTVEMKNWPLLITADTLFCVEEDEEEDPRVVEYSYSWQEG